MRLWHQPRVLFLGAVFIYVVNVMIWFLSSGEALWPDLAGPDALAQAQTAAEQFHLALPLLVGIATARWIFQLLGKTEAPFGAALFIAVTVVAPIYAILWVGPYVLIWALGGALVQSAGIAPRRVATGAALVFGAVGAWAALRLVRLRRARRG